MASEHFFRPAAAICAWIYGVVLLGLLGAGSAAAQTVTYIHTDALGSVVAETDANGNVIKRYDYEPGAQIGEDGVSSRQTNSSGGQSIDIPANDEKPHETLHYD
ncbi:TPA: hypothetical protein ACGY72_003320 [Stenotrophomonas maltophilia]